MKGHVRERSPGHWAIILDIHDPRTGKRRRKWHSFKGNKRAAEKECARLIHEMNVGSYIVPSRATLGAYLDIWLNDVKSRISPKTHVRYSEICRKNIVPLLGQTLLKELQPAQISHAYSRLLENGHRKGGGLSAGSVRHAHRILKQALAQAVRWGGDWAISRNPCDAVRPPKAAPATMHVYDVEQTVALLDAIRGSRLFPAVLLAALCGLRLRRDRCITLGPGRPERGLARNRAERRANQNHCPVQTAQNGPGLNGRAVAYASRGVVRASPAAG